MDATSQGSPPDVAHEPRWQVFPALPQVGVGVAPALHTRLSGVMNVVLVHLF
jgi:hypothetical protein